MLSYFKVGHRVKIATSTSFSCGKLGTVIWVKFNEQTIDVRLDDGPLFGTFRNVDVELVDSAQVWSLDALRVAE